MPHDIARTGFQPSVSLQHDFGHSPVGNLGGRTVQQVGAGEPRSGGGLLGALKSLGARIAQAFESTGVRAQREYRQGLESTSRQVGDLLGALCKGQDRVVDGLGAKKIIEGLRGTAEPLTSRGAKYDDVFKARVEVNLKQMTGAQLRELKAGLEMARNSPLAGEPGIDRHLQAIQGALDSELLQRLDTDAQPRLLDRFRTCIAQVPRDPGAPGSIAYKYQDLLLETGKLLREAGHEKPSEDMKRSLVKDVLDRAMAAGELDPVDVAAVLLRLDTREMLDLQKAGVPTGLQVPEPPENVNRLLARLVIARAEEAQRAVGNGTQALLGEPLPLGDSRAFTNRLVETVTRFDDLVNHCETHGLPLDDVTVARVDDLKEHLGRLFVEANIRLEALSENELAKLNAALAKLGVPHGREEIAAEIRKRQDQAKQNYAEALKKAVDCARGNDPKGLLLALGDLHVRQNESFLTLQAFQGKAVRDENKLGEIRQRMMIEAVHDMDTDTLVQAFGALHTLESRVLGAVLVNEGNDLSGDHRELGLEMLNAGQDMDLLRECLTNELVSRGFSLPPLPDEGRYGITDLDTQGREAMREVYGVEVTGANLNVKIGVGSEPVQLIHEGNIETLSDAPLEPKEVLFENGTKLVVDDALWRDFSRARYNFGPQGGGSESLVDLDDWEQITPQERNLRREAGVQKLLEVCGGNETLMQSVSKFANQNGIAGLQEAFVGEHSPIRLPDGTPGALFGPQEAQRMVYTIRPDGNGGVTLRIDFSIDNPTLFLPSDGSPQRLMEPGGKAHFTFELSFAPDGRVKVSEPVQFLYDIRTIDQEPD
jgi:hypothetical protein